MSYAILLIEELLCYSQNGQQPITVKFSKHLTSKVFEFSFIVDKRQSQNVIPHSIKCLHQNCLLLILIQKNSVHFSVRQKKTRYLEKLIQLYILVPMSSAHIGWRENNSKIYIRLDKLFSRHFSVLNILSPGQTVKSKFFCFRQKTNTLANVLLKIEVLIWRIELDSASQLPQDSISHALTENLSREYRLIYVMAYKSC